MVCLPENKEGRSGLEKRYLAGIDIGTSGCKSIIIDETGRSWEQLGPDPLFILHNLAGLTDPGIGGRQLRRA